MLQRLPSAVMSESAGIVPMKELNAKWFYLLLYPIALRTLSLSPLNLSIIPFKLNGKNGSICFFIQQHFLFHPLKLFQHPWLLSVSIRPCKVSFPEKNVELQIEHPQLRTFIGYQVPLHIWVIQIYLVCLLYRISFQQ